MGGTERSRSVLASTVVDVRDLPAVTVLAPRRGLKQIKILCGGTISRRNLLAMRASWYLSARSRVFEDVSLVPRGVTTARMHSNPATGSSYITN